MLRTPVKEAYELLEPGNPFGGVGSTAASEYKGELLLNALNLGTDPCAHLEMVQNIAPPPQKKLSNPKP